MMYEEIPGKSCPAGTESETLSAVRSALLEVENEQPKRRQLFGGVQATKPGRAAKRVSKASRFNPLPSVERDEVREKGPGLLARLRLTERFKRLRSQMPKVNRKYALVVAFALIVLLKPLLVLSLLVLLAFVVAAFFLLVGGDKIWRGVMLALHQMSDKEPARALRIRKRLDSFAMNWDAFLDRFPDGTVDGLYMPDFQVLSEDEARNEALFARRMEHLREHG